MNEGGQPGQPDRRRLSRPARTTLLVLGAIVALGLGVRLVNVVVLRPVCPASGPEGGCYNVLGFPNDANYGHLQARLIAQGHPWVSPYLGVRPPPGDDRTFHEIASAAVPSGEDRPSAGDPPGYQALLAAASFVGFESAQSQRIVTSFIGTTTIVTVFFVARRLGRRRDRLDSDTAAPTAMVGRASPNERAGLVAAGLAAVYPMLWINDGMLLSEGLYVPLAALFLLAAYRFVEEPALGRAVALAAAIAAAGLTRAEALLLLPATAWVLFLTVGAVGRRTRIGWVLASGLVVGLAYAPWSVWNLIRFEEPVLVTSTTGAVLSASACDETFYGNNLGTYANCYNDVVIDDSLDESERDVVVRELATDYIRSNVDRLPVVVAARVGRMWELYRPMDNNVQDWLIEGRGRRSSTIGRAMYFALLPLAVAGVVVAARRDWPISPLLGPAVVVTLTAATTFGNTRYRAPVEVCIVIAAAVALDVLADLVVSSRGARRSRSDRAPAGHGTLVGS